MQRKGYHSVKEDCKYVEKIKKAVGPLPQLYHPSREDTMVIETDASEKHWGGILKAITPSGDEHIYRYASGTFTVPEQNYHSNEKEILALIKTIKRFKIFLLPKHFIARSDNQNVGYFVRTNISGDYKQGRLVRWQQFLQYYNFDIEYIEGTKNVLADIMSRLTCLAG